MLRRFLTVRGRFVAAGAGALLTLSFSPFNLWWLAPLTVALLFTVLEGASLRERSLRAFWFGIGSFSTGTYWLYISLHFFGGLAPPIAAALCAALILLMSTYLAGWGYLSGLLAPREPVWQFLAVLPALWVVVEWLRGWLLTGFPWLSLGYGQLEGPLAVWAPVLGLYGVSLLLVLGAGALAAVVAAAHGGRIAGVSFLAGLMLLTWFFAGVEWTAPVGKPLNVSLVQGGISQSRKWLPEELANTKALFLNLTLKLDRADLIVWPEAAIPALAHEEEEFLTLLRKLMRARQQELILGMLTFDEKTGEFRNSLLAIGSEQSVYHKRHLVPFGEYFPVPDFIRSALRFMNLPYTDISKGPENQEALRIKGVLLAPSICYEDAFGNELRAFLPRAALLVNVSNDGWFGASIAPHQHLQMARYRALEAGRFMLRSTNTGITAIIDPFGRVVSQGAQFKAAVVSARVQPREGATPWVKFGNGPVLGICALLLLAALESVRQRIMSRFW